MECRYFGICGSCTLYGDYEQKLDEKVKSALEILPLKLEPTVIKSPEIFYRNRAEFRIYKKDDDIFYALNSVDKKVFAIDACPKVDKNIYELMPKLLDELKKSEMLTHKLFSVEFLSSNKDMLVTLLYHKKIDESWLQEAHRCLSHLNIKLIGRSRKVKLQTSEDFVDLTLNVKDKNYHYRVYENAFSQPNTKVNEQMISWVLDSLDGGEDLLELYCGHGNFTIAFSSYFRRILATEISKTSINSALSNCKLNQIDNITFLRMSVEELVSAFKKEREFFRLKDMDLDSFHFSHVFVDPPRAGLDEKSLSFIKNFDNIIYISCNVQTLKRDLEVLLKTHKAEKFAFFDQFAYTKHLESGVALSRL